MTIELMNDDIIVGVGVGNQSTGIKTCPSATLFTTNITRTERTQVSALKGRRLIAWSMTQPGKKRSMLLMCAQHSAVSWCVCACVCVCVYLNVLWSSVPQVKFKLRIKFIPIVPLCQCVSYTETNRKSQTSFTEFEYSLRHVSAHLTNFRCCNMYKILWMILSQSILYIPEDGQVCRNISSWKQ
jgi:hypothetical protein